MKKSILLIILVLFICVGVNGDNNYKYINSWDTDIYFGHVIYPEAQHDGKDAVVIREGKQTPEIADLNLPLVPGDTIRTSDRRCEIQFDTGTVIRLDRNTELKIETILAQCLSSKNQLTNFLLFKGQVYVMYKKYIRQEIFQVITPNAAVKLNHNAVSLIDASAEGGTDIHMSEGKGYALYGPNENSIKRQAVKKSQKIVITPDNQAVASHSDEIEDFVAWNEKLSREFDAYHEGKAVIPLPIQKLSKGVVYFAQKYSNLFGEWIWDRYLGYVWRPYLNDRSYPGGGWMPYYQGRWTSVQGQLFWVPSEAWGWVPYHLGIWIWNKKKGWLWIPGSVFAPAWVDWSFSRGLFCWRPWSIIDWYSYAVYQDGYFPYFIHLTHPDDDPYIVDGKDDPFVLPWAGTSNVKQVITQEQLKKKATPIPMPKEWREAYKRVVIAIKNGEDEILSTLRETPNHMLVVSQSDLNASRINEKVVKLTNLSQDKQKDFLSPKSGQDPSLQAKQTFNRNEKIVTLRQKVTDLKKDLEGLKSLEIQQFQKSKVIIDSKSGDIRNRDRKDVSIQTSEPPAAKSNVWQPGSLAVIPVDKNAQGVWRIDSRSLRSGRCSTRIHDWNPDAKVARQAGISIRYSSLTNEVKCPELNISSRHVLGSRGYEGPRVHLTMRGTITPSSMGSGVVAGATSSGSSSGASSSKASSTNTGDKKTASSGKGSVVKK